jgi:hypothetical protein
VKALESKDSIARTLTHVCAGRPGALYFTL